MSPRVASIEHLLSGVCISVPKDFEVNTLRLYTSIIENDSYLSDACLFSSSYIDDSVMKALRFGQKVIEAQWMTESTACLILLLQSEVGDRLFDNVFLIPKSEWDMVIDTSEVRLLNREMYEICKADDVPFIGLQHFSSESLTNIFSEQMFIVGGVYVQ